MGEEQALGLADDLAELLLIRFARVCPGHGRPVERGDLLPQAVSVTRYRPVGLPADLPEDVVTDEDRVAVDDGDRPA